jgi:O-antigen ligase
MTVHLSADSDLAVTESEGDVGRSPLDMLVLGAVALHCLMYLPGVLYTSWTGRTALLLLTLPAGLLAIARLVRARDRQAALLAAFVAVAVVSALASGAGHRAIVGAAIRQSSALVVLGSVSLWALCRCLGPWGRRHMPAVVVGSLAVNALVGVLQVVLRPRAGAFDADIWQFRAYGMSGNPVFFGAVSAGAAAVAIAVARTRSGRPFLTWLAAVTWLTVAVYVSGSRIALVALFASAVLMLAFGERRRVVAGIAASIGGTIVGWGISAIFNASTGTIGRGVNAGDTIDRFAAWRAGWSGFLERPVLGWGLGEFRTAAQHHLDLDVALSVGFDTRSEGWADPHNAVIGLLVMVGVVGLAVIGAFGFAAARTCRGPMAWFVLPVLLTWMLQPVTLVTLPLVFAALGASAPPPTLRERPVRDVPRTDLALFAGGLVVSLVMVVTLTRLGRADNGDEAAAIARWFPGDATIANLVSVAYLQDRDDPREAAKALEWAEEAARRDPSRPRYWTEVAGLQLIQGDFEAAERAARQALDLQRWDSLAWLMLGAVAQQTQDSELLAEVDGPACALGLPMCGASADGT